MPVNKFGGMSKDFYRSNSEVSRNRTYLNNNFLRTDGSKPAIDPLNMDTNKISNVVDPLNDQDAATKHYVDDIIRNVVDPLNDQDVATKHYVDTTFVNMFIKMQKDHVQKHQKIRNY